MNEKSPKKKIMHRKKRLHVRITSKQRLGLELMRRKKHRSISSLIVRLIEHEMKTIKVSSYLPRKNKKVVSSLQTSTTKKAISIKQATHKLHCEHQADQFVAFALNFPHLLTGVEKELWVLIDKNPSFWEIITTRAKNAVKHSAKNIDTKQKRVLKSEILRQYWQSLNQIAQDFYHHQLCEL